MWYGSDMILQPLVYYIFPKRRQCINLRPKKKNCYLALTRPISENWVGRSVDFFFFFFFFFLRTVRELSFPIFFFKFLNGENSGGMQSKRIYTSAFLSHWIQILANSSPKSDIFNNKKTWPCFFAFYGRSGEGNITIFFFWPNDNDAWNIMGWVSEKCVL